jgi:PAS domain S-box-containing protein
MVAKTNPSDSPAPPPTFHSKAFVDAENLLAAYFSSSNVGLCILDSNLRYVTVNKKLAELNGYPAFEHLGKTIRQVLGDLADVIERQCRQVISEGEPVELEVSGKAARGQEPGNWIAHYLPIKDETGAVTQIGAVIVEATYRKKLEDSLQEVGLRLQNELQRFQILLDVGTVLSTNWEPREFFPHVSARVRRILRQEYASLVLHDPATGSLVPPLTRLPSR